MLQHQGLVPQPIEQHLAVGGIEDVGHRVAAFELAVPMGNSQEMEVVVAEHGADAAFVLLDVAQAVEGLGAAVDDIAYQPKGVAAVVEADVGEQFLKFGETALQIADCVVCHDVCVRGDL